MVTHVPIGLNVPYRTVQGEEYYIRAGSDFLRAPHAVLAGMFGRQPLPNFEIIVRHREVRQIGSEYQLSLEVFVRNVGRGLAEDIFFIAEGYVDDNYSVTFQMTEPQRWNFWDLNRNGRQGITVISNSFPPLPPGSEVLIGNLDIRASLAPPDGISMDLTCGARNGPGASRTITFRQVDMSAIFSVWSSRPEDQGDRAGTEKIIKETVDGCLTQ